jgi:hypothetical protein
MRPWNGLADPLSTTTFGRSSTAMSVFRTHVTPLSVVRVTRTTAVFPRLMKYAEPSSA